MVYAGGVPIGQPFVSKIDESDWREVIETELIGFTRVVAATLPVFRQQGSGNFVSVVSVANYSYPPGDALRSEEHTSELQSLMRISYAVFCLKKKNTNTK